MRILSVRSLTAYALFVVVASLLTPALAHTHGGGLDKNGCHTNRKTGVYHCHGTPKTPPAAAASRSEDTVSFNKNTLKFHCPSCSAARRCTANCISISRSEAKKRGGIACKICGGSC